MGVIRKYGCLPRVTDVGEVFPVLGSVPDVAPLLPESSWNDYDGTKLMEHFWHTIDQAQQGSCTGCGTVGAMMAVREFMGLNRVVLSQAVPYALGNGGKDRGMAIDAGLSNIGEHGTCPAVAPVHDPDAVVVGQYDWFDYYSRTKFPAGWQDEAKRYRGLRAWDCPTYQHAVSAILLGYPVVYGCDGHCVIMCGHKNGDHIDKNSWGRDWGNNGFGRWRSRQTVANQLPRYGAWALYMVVDPTNDMDLPKVKSARQPGLGSLSQFPVAAV